jgi:hypothetical protein
LQKNWLHVLRNFELKTKICLAEVTAQAKLELETQKDQQKAQSHVRQNLKTNCTDVAALFDVHWRYPRMAHSQCAASVIRD